MIKHHIIERKVFNDKKIAVIGCRWLYEFTTWCKNQNLRRHSDKIYYDDVGFSYFGIFTQLDMAGLRFDGYVEVDNLKTELMLRLKGENK